MKKTLFVELRERILTTYDAGRQTRQAVADRLRVSLGMVKKRLQQRKRTGDVRPAIANFWPPSSAAIC